MVLIISSLVITTLHCLLWSCLESYNNKAGLVGFLASFTLYVTVLRPLLGGLNLKIGLVVLLKFVIHALLLFLTIAGIINHFSGTSVTSSIIATLLSMAMSGKLQHQGGTCGTSSILYSLLHFYLWPWLGSFNLKVGLVLLLLSLLFTSLL